MHQQTAGSTSKQEITYRWLEDSEFAYCVHAFDNYGVKTPDPQLSRIMGAFNEENELIGFLTVQLLPHFSPIWVHENYRRQGIGGKLADTAIAKLKGAGVEVYCFSNNAEVLKMMIDRGFKSAGIFYSAKL